MSVLVPLPCDETSALSPSSHKAYFRYTNTTLWGSLGTRGPYATHQFCIMFPFSLLAAGDITDWDDGLPWAHRDIMLLNRLREICWRKGGRWWRLCPARGRGRSIGMWGKKGRCNRARAWGCPFKNFRSRKGGTKRSAGMLAMGESSGGPIWSSAASSSTFTELSIWPEDDFSGLKAWVPQGCIPGINDCIRR